MPDDTPREYLSRIGSIVTPESSAASRANQRRAAAARRGRPATIGVKRLRELVQAWRERADAASDSYAASIEQCADDLEQLLTQ